MSHWLVTTGICICCFLLYIRELVPLLRVISSYLPDLGPSTDSSQTAPTERTSHVSAVISPQPSVTLSPASSGIHRGHFPEICRNSPHIKVIHREQREHSPDGAEYLSSQAPRRPIVDFVSPIDWNHNTKYRNRMNSFFSTLKSESGFCVFTLVFAYQNNRNLIFGATNIFISKYSAYIRAHSCFSCFVSFWVVSGSLKLCVFPFIVRDLTPGYQNPMQTDRSCRPCS